MLGVKIIIQFIGFGFTTIVSLATLSLSARFFGPEVLGEVNYLLGILGLLLLFSDLGFSRAHIRFVSNKKNVREKIGVFLATKLFLLFFFIAFALIYFYLAKIGEREYLFIFLILAAYEFFNRLGTSLLYTFEGLQAVTLENFAFGAGKFVKLLILIIVIFLSRNILGLSLAYFSEGLVVVLLSFFLLKKYWPFKFNKKILKSYFRYSLPFFVIYPLSYIQGNAGVVLLKIFWNSASVGYYSAAVGLAGFVKSMYGVVISLFFPRMSEIFSKKEFSKFQEHINTASKYLLLIFLPIFLSLYFLKHEVIFLILGNQFGPSENIFSLSLLGIFFLMISVPYDQALYASGKHHILAPITVISVFGGIFLQLIFIPQTIFSIKMFGMGAEGVVLSNTIIWFLVGVFQIYLVNKLLKVKFFYKNLLPLFPGSLLIAIYIQLNIYSLNIGIKIVFCIVSVLIHYFFSLKVGLITNADKKYFLKVLSPKNIMKQGVFDIKENL